MSNKQLYVFALLLMTVILVLGFVFFQNDKSPVKNNYVVGIVNPNPGMSSVVASFIDGMASRGFKVGENITYILHESKDNMDSAINSMVDQKVDMLYTLTTPATRMAKKVTKKNGIPVVFTMHDPIKSGIIKSLYSLDTNLTGVQLRGSTYKALEWLLVLAPETKHVFVPLKYDTKAASQSLADLREAAAQFGIKLTSSKVESEEELGAVLSSMPDDVDAIFVLHSILIYSSIDKIISAAIARKIPIGSGSSLHEQGVTVSFGHSSSRVGHQASRLASRILTGHSANETPAEIADFYLGINLKTAEASGVEISSDVLRQADYIVRE